jgi:hypothetical protein
MLFQTNNPDSLYSHIVKKNFSTATELMSRGEKIPEILYAQVTGRDDVSIFNFLIQEEPLKIQYLTELAMCQGAINCIKLLVDKGFALSPALLTISPRKNSELTLQYVNETVLKQSTPSKSIDNTQHTTLVCF